MNSENKKSYAEERIRKITLVYYSRPDIRKAIYEFSKNRECIPRYYQGFGKRPDTFMYESEVLESVRKGATSFHCSEELWTDPLEISTELTKKELEDLRCGWDLLLDIDSPYLEYSKIYADLLIQVLRFHDIKNFKIKFSGSKGFHLIVPWQAFPSEIYGHKTKEMFPEWPRIICEYLSSLIKEKLENKILDNETYESLSNKTGTSQTDLAMQECLKCKRNATKKDLITWKCPRCKNEITQVEGYYNNRKKARCPDCRKDLLEIARKNILYCEFCKIDSEKSPDMFADKVRLASEKLIDADLVLVSSRHLFRMPYSLHEKTALASIVLDPDKIKNFQITDAKPLKVNTEDFYPKAEKDEAKRLLLEALEWKERNDFKENIANIDEEKSEKKSFIKSSQKKDLKKITIKFPSSDLYPPQIKLLLNGVKNDGRKRALFILLSFFYSLGTDDDVIYKTITNWNEKNYNPLKKGYIDSQISWFSKNPSRFPPNFSNPLYRELGVDKPDEFSKKLKNPVSYAIKKYLLKNK